MFRKRYSFSKKKVALLTTIIAPYRIPCFNKVAESKDLDFDVFFYAEITKNREWKIYKEKIKFNYTVLKGLHFCLKSKRTLHLNFGLAFHILRKKYDLIVIGGYDQPTAWEAFIFSKLLKTKIFLFGESTLKDQRSGNWVYENLKRFLIKKSDGFLPAGKAAAEYFKHLGANSDKIFIAPFPAIHGFLKKEFLRLSACKKELKIKKGYSNITILFSGRFVHRKGILYLIKAYVKLKEERQDICLVLLGDGPEKEKYENYCKENKIDNVFFEGFIQQEDLPQYYASADIFVLPSLSEPWGLVINEAMAFGLPVISTDAAGATYDLVKDGKNGFVVRAGEETDLYKALKILCNNQELRKKMGRESLKIIEDYTPEKWAQSFIYAVNRTLEA